MTHSIHSHALVDPKATLGKNVEIGPFCIVGPNVILGDNVKLISHVSLMGHTQIGADCILYPYVSMGHPPQDLKHKGGQVRIIIGERNIFRELVNIHPGTDAGVRDTIIGNDCYMMVGTHLAHECHMGHNVVVSNGAQIGGAVTIGDRAILGGLCAIHQHTRIGAQSFVGGMATVTQDVIPFGFVVGNPAYLSGLNVIGLKRSGYSKDDIRDLRSAYRLLFAKEGTFQERVKDASHLYAQQELVMKIVSFIQGQEKRPVAMPRHGE